MQKITQREMLAGKAFINRSHHHFIKKPMLIAMKLMIVLMTVTFVQVSARSFSQNVTFRGVNVQLEKIFASVKQQTGMVFAYQMDLLKDAKPVTVDVSNMELKAFLHLVLKDQPFVFSIENKTVTIMRKASIVEGVISSAETVIDLEGKVINKKGEPVEGASVTIKGTSEVVATNDKGEFSLKGVEENAILVISGVNIEMQEVRVGGRRSLVVRVEARVNEGEEVVVSTGYQQISKERFVGSYAQLDSVNYHRRAGMSIIDRLDGTVPGLLFNKKGGEAPLQIRGISTINSNKYPLIVLDNFPLSGSPEYINSIVNNINPNEIENITVLKDAAATSIWGARAGNGVIVITTKRGQFNRALSISITSNVTMVDKPDLFYTPQMKVSDYIDVEQFLFDKQFRFDDTANINMPVFSPVYEILFRLKKGEILQAQADAEIDMLRNTDVRNDINRYIYERSLNQQHYINLNGGNNTLNYSFSFGYNNNQHGIKGSTANSQYTVNSANVFRPFKNFELETNINYSRGSSNKPQFAGAGLFLYEKLKDENGNALPITRDYRMLFVDTAGNGKLLDWHYRPLDEMNFTRNKTTKQFIRVNAGASYKLTSWLKGEIKYQVINQTVATQNYQSPQSYYTRNVINRFTNINETDPNLRNPVPMGGILNVTDEQALNQNFRGQFTVNKNFRNIHQLSMLLAGEISDMKSNSNSGQFFGYDDATATYATSINYGIYYPLYGNTAYAQISNENAVSEGRRDRFVSFLGNASYTFNNRYSIYASARKDGANVFGVNTNRKWKPLWSTGVSWDISKENFYSVKWIPYLRLRGSLGYAGNAGNGSGLPTIYVSTDGARYTNFPYATLGEVPNPDLRWEEVRTTNFGVDFGVVNNRVTGNIDFYSKKSSDLLGFAPVDPTTGVSSFFLNIADLKANGFDLQLNSLNINGKIKWSTTFSLSYSKVIVTRYNDIFEQTQFTNNYLSYAINPREGQIAWGISSYRWAGLDPDNGDPQGYLNKTTSKDYMALLNDSLKNQRLNGSAIPLYYGNFLNSFSWKNFAFSANITYRLKYYFRKPTINYTSLYNGYVGHSDYALRWQQAGDENRTTVPSMSYPASSNRDQFYQYSEVNVEKGDHIRLQDIRLSYNWTNTKFRNLPINSIQVFTYVNNLNIMLWKANNSGLDPDFTGGGLIILPPSRTYAGGISINF